MSIFNPFRSLSEYQNSVRNMATRTTDWFHDRVRQLSDYNFNRNPTYEKLEKRNTKTALLVPGRMYMFSYDPKHKDTLPIYDKFPLLFPYALTDNGFIGLNVHYLPGQQRVAIMNSLLNIYTINSRRADRLSWDFLRNAALFPGADKCIHQYLWNHVRSPFLEIQHSDWLVASTLPVEQFVYKQ